MCELVAMDSWNWREQSCSSGQSRRGGSQREWTSDEKMEYLKCGLPKLESCLLY